MFTLPIKIIGTSKKIAKIVSISVKIIVLVTILLCVKNKKISRGKNKNLSLLILSRGAGSTLGGQNSGFD